MTADAGAGAIVSRWSAVFEHALCTLHLHPLGYIVPGNDCCRMTPIPAALRRGGIVFATAAPFQLHCVQRPLVAGAGQILYRSVLLSRTGLSEEKL